MKTHALITAWCLLFILNMLPTHGEDPASPSWQRVESHGPMCGVYSLIAAASAMGVSVDPHVLWNSRFVSEESGSTAVDLIEAAAEFGIQAQCRRNLGSVGKKVGPSGFFVGAIVRGRQTAARARQREPSPFASTSHRPTSHQCWANAMATRRGLGE